LKITGILVAVILMILIILPFAFKGKMLEAAKTGLNRNLNAKVDFDRLGLNFFRSFPNVSVSLSRFYVGGINEFEGDTLLYADNLSATIHLKSLFGNSGFEINKLSVDKALLHAIILADGTANWNLVKTDETEEQTEESNFKLLLKKVSVSRSDILYDDFSNHINVAAKGLNLNLSGNMTAEETTIRTNFTIAALTFIMDKIPYLSDAKAQADMNINANLKDMKFTLAENKWQINEIKTHIDGWVALPDDESMDMDLRLNAPATQFKDVLSLIPAIYAKDFKNLKTEGEASLNAWVKGKMTGDTLPAFEVGLNVAKAMFQYPGMPQSVRQISASFNVSNAGGSADNTIIDIPQFHLEMAGNPFDVKLHLSKPASDPNIQLSAAGHLNLNKIKEVYPLENMELSGNLNANLQLAMRMSHIQKEQYDKVQASGTLDIKDMLVKQETGNSIQIRNAHLSFSPRYVDLGAFSAQMGKNDLAGSGKLENFIPCFLKGETLKGRLDIRSNYFNLNDFMTNETASPGNTTSLGVIEIPKNIDFNLTGNFKQVIFDRLDMTDVSGQILVKDGKVDMKNMVADALGGKLDINGYYDTGNDPEKPEVSLDLNIKNVSFVKTFSTFVTIRKLAPIFENLTGNYSTHFRMKSALSADFMPDLASLTANGLLQSDQVEVKNTTLLNGLAAALKNESLKDLKVKDLNLPFSISEGRVAVQPFDVRFGSGTMNLSGTTGLDQSIDYTAKINLTDKLSNSYLKNVNVKIGGTFTNPKFSVDMKDLADQALGKITDSILGGNNSGASLTEKVNDQIDRQIETIRQQAKEAGDQLIDEAQKQGRKLVDEAGKTSNPLAKAAAVKAAEIAAQKLNDEAQKKADQLNAEAEKQIEALKK
jgi:hypothetical protein